MTNTDTFVVLPDVVQMVTNFLRAQTELTQLVGSRIYSILPGDRTYPLLVVTQVADLPMMTRPWWGVQTDLQLQGYDLASNTARHVVEVTRSLLAQRSMTAHAEGSISWVTFANLAIVPDTSVLTTSGRPIPRWITTATVTAHP
jgi:hypothetical protein